MTSYLWSWIGALLIAAFSFHIFNKKIPARARHRNLARLGAALLASGIGLVVPTYHEHTRPLLEALAITLGVIGLALCLYAVREK